MGINCIVCSNYLHLSDHLIRIPDREERRAFIHRLSKFIVLTNYHINFNGIYDFVDEIDLTSLPFDLSAISQLEI